MKNSTINDLERVVFVHFFPVKIKCHQVDTDPLIEVKFANMSMDNVSSAVCSLVFFGA